MIHPAESLCFSTSPFSTGNPPAGIMPSKTRAQQVRSSLASESDHHEHSGGSDDELARELELERQQLLAAAAGNIGPASSNGGKTSSVSDTQDQSQDEDEDQDDEESLGGDAGPDEEDSDDEWMPPAPASKPTRQNKRRRAASSSEDSEIASGTETLDEELSSTAKKPKTAAKTQKQSTIPSGNSSRQKAQAANASQTNTHAEAQEEEYDSFDEEAERVQAQVEAAAAWADVRKRKDAAQAQPASNGASSQASAPSSSNKAATSVPSLTAWLGKGPSASSSVSELTASLPMPTTCSAAQIVDRSSLFVGYVYPLTTTSSAYISALLSHLTRVVHPTVPVDLLPPQFANAPASKRGSSHDMYAYRVFELKRGRTGLAGPDDFSLQEQQEDDGEKWGGDRVQRIAREEGASDVLVVVSRWYGGELLGPVRFEHIENAARAALQEYMAKEEVDEFRHRIQHLDRKIASAKAEVNGAALGRDVDVDVVEYKDLTLEKAQRLWLARQKTLDALQKRKAARDQQASQETTVQGEQPPSSLGQQDGEQDSPPPPVPEPTEAVASPSSAAASSAAAEATASDVEDVKREPGNEETPDASADAATNATRVKSEPDKDQAADTAELSAEMHIKPEPVDPGAPLRVKHDPDAAPSPARGEDDEKPALIRVKPEATEDPAIDLTGWDDL